MSEFDQTRRSLVQRLLVDPLVFWPTAAALGDFYQQLASLLRAGLPILRALSTLRRQCNSGSIRRRLPLMVQHIEQGGNVASAFALFPNIFDRVDIAMIRAGEYGGNLDRVLDSLSEAHKQRSRLVKKFITGILYPVFVLHFAIFVLPFVETIQNSEKTYLGLLLPRLGILYGALFVLLVVPRLLRQFQPTAFAVDTLKSLVPVYAGVTEKLAVARFARALDGLYTSGMTLLEALPVAADACGNEPLRRRARRLVPFIHGGETLSGALEQVGGFPLPFVNMIATGEEGGQLSEMLTNTARYYEETAETALSRAAAVLPVVFYLAVAGWVGFQIVKTLGGIIRQRTTLPPM